VWNAQSACSCSDHLCMLMHARARTETRGNPDRGTRVPATKSCGLPVAKLCVENRRFRRRRRLIKPRCVMVPTSKRAMAFAVVSPLMPMASAFMGYTIPEFMGKSSSVVPEPLRAVKPAAHATTATTASPTTPFLPHFHEFGFSGSAHEPILYVQPLRLLPNARSCGFIPAWRRSSRLADHWRLSSRPRTRSSGRYRAQKACARASSKRRTVNAQRPTPQSAPTVGQSARSLLLRAPLQPPSASSVVLLLALCRPRRLLLLPRGLCRPRCLLFLALDLCRPRRQPPP